MGSKRKQNQQCQCCLKWYPKAAMMYINFCSDYCKDIQFKKGVAIENNKTRN